MKVSMKTERGHINQGWFSRGLPVHKLIIEVDYAPDEIAVINDAGLGRYELTRELPLTEKQAQGNLLIWEHHEGCRPISVAFFLNTRVHVLSFENALKASNAADEVKQNLVHLKTAIEKVTTTPAQQSFEL